MKILYITPFPPTKNGIADYAVAFRRVLSNHKTINDIEVLPLKSERHLSCNGISNLVEIRNDVKNWRDRGFGFDIIHVELGYNNNRELYYGYYFQKYFPHIPLFATLHDPPLVTMVPMKFLGFESFPRPIRALRRALDLTIGKFIENQMLKKMTNIFVLTNNGKALLQTRIGKPFSEKIAVIPHTCYLRTEDFPSYQCRYDAPKIIILLAGFFTLSKGPAILVKALELFYQKEKNASVPVELWLQGEHSTAARQNRDLENFKESIKSSSIRDRIKFIDYLSQDSFEKLFTQVHIAVFPYLKPINTKLGGSSAVLMRAMSAGLPVIASKVLSFPEEIIDGETGLLFEAGDASELSDKINLLVGNPALRQRLGNKAKQKIIKNHSWEKVSEKVYEAYQSVTK